MNMKRKGLLRQAFFFPLVVIVGCGGGGNESVQLPVTPQPTPTPTPEPMECDAHYVIAPIELLSSGGDVPGSAAVLAYDNVISSESRWESASPQASLTLRLGKSYQINSIRIAWVDGATLQHQFSLATSLDDDSFTIVGEPRLTSGRTSQFEHYELGGTVATALRIATNLSGANNGAISEVLIQGCALDNSPNLVSSDVSVASFGLDPQKAPGEQFDLLTWALDTPADLDNNERADRTSETALRAGFQDDFFYTGADGGMVLKSTIEGAKTSANTSYTRSELREMLRRGNTSISTRGIGLNNWLLGYQPDIQIATGGRGGHLSTTMAVNRVTETGEDFQVGRIIIGQIHAQDDEPIRLYYRKFPDHDVGYFYYAHERRGGEDVYQLITSAQGDIVSSQPVLTDLPIEGVALNEIFTYDIIQHGAFIDVILRKGSSEGPIIGHQTIDMESLNSGYDTPDEWMYFKAGAYSQNNTGVSSEFDQVTIYRLRNEH